MALITSGLIQPLLLVHFALSLLADVHATKTEAPDQEASLSQTETPQESQADTSEQEALPSLAGPSQEASPSQDAGLAQEALPSQEAASSQEAANQVTYETFRLPFTIAGGIAGGIIHHHRRRQHHRKCDMASVADAEISCPATCEYCLRKQCGLSSPHCAAIPLSRMSPIVPESERRALVHLCATCACYHKDHLGVAAYSELFGAGDEASVETGGASSSSRPLKRQRVSTEGSDIGEVESDDEDGYGYGYGSDDSD